MLKSGVRLQGSQAISKFTNSKPPVCNLGFVICILFIILYLLPGISFAQGTDDLEFTLDTSSNTTPLPKIFKPAIDLSGRGSHRDITWPQTMAAREVLDVWQKDIGFGGLYRVQYNLWEISQLSKDKDAQGKLTANYEAVIKNISDAGGTVILDIFGTPAGMGKVLDKKSPPSDLKKFKVLVKGLIRDLSCNKKYNIWYELWNAPDLDDFFLGRKQEYFNLYRQVAEAVKELEAETKSHIPLGGPSVSWWFQNLDGNTIINPEGSLIYELIKFCYRYRLPLDFISWHSYSTGPASEKENTLYKKTAVNLIRDWLSYFNFSKGTPLVVDEWNYDRSANVLPERQEKAYISASFIPSRLENMYEAGVDYQIYYCLEDFQNNKERVVRNVGVFFFDSEHSEYKGGPKAAYNAFRILSLLGTDMFGLKVEDEFVGVIATKAQDSFIILIYNYIDPEIAVNYLSKNIAGLNGAERKVLLGAVKSGALNKILLKQSEVSSVRTTKTVKELLKRVQELNDRATKFLSTPRNIKIGIKNLKEDYLYQRYVVDSSCAHSCKFLPQEEKEINAQELYQETLALAPYSVNLIVLKKKPKEAQKEAPAVEATGQATTASPEADNKPKEQPAPGNPPAQVNTDTAAPVKQEDTSSTKPKE